MNSLCLYRIDPHLLQFLQDGNSPSVTGKCTCALKAFAIARSTHGSGTFAVSPVMSPRQHRAHYLALLLSIGVGLRTGHQKHAIPTTPAFGCSCAGMRNTRTAILSRNCPAFDAAYLHRAPSPMTRSWTDLKTSLCAYASSFDWPANWVCAPRKSVYFTTVTSAETVEGGQSVYTAKEGASDTSRYHNHSLRTYASYKATTTRRGCFLDASTDTSPHATSAKSVHAHSPASGHSTLSDTDSPPPPTNTARTSWPSGKHWDTPVSRPPPATQTSTPRN